MQRTSLRSQTTRIPHGLIHCRILRVDIHFSAIVHLFFKASCLTLSVGNLLHCLTACSMYAWRKRAWGKIGLASQSFQTETPNPASNSRMCIAILDISLKYSVLVIISYHRTVIKIKRIKFVKALWKVKAIIPKWHWWWGAAGVVKPQTKSWHLYVLREHSYTSHLN